MKIRVRYFAAFREATGVGQEVVETEAASTSELFTECAGHHPDLQKYTASLVAINDEMAAWDALLNENDEVLFFPPVAGG